MCIYREKKTSRIDRRNIHLTLRVSYVDETSNTVLVIMTNFQTSRFHCHEDRNHRVFLFHFRYRFKLGRQKRAEKPTELNYEK